MQFGPQAGSDATFWGCCRSSSTSSNSSIIISVIISLIPSISKGHDAAFEGRKGANIWRCPAVSYKTVCAQCNVTDVTLHHRTTLLFGRFVRTSAFIPRGQKNDVFQSGGKAAEAVELKIYQPTQLPRASNCTSSSSKPRTRYNRAGSN